MLPKVAHRQGKAGGCGGTRLGRVDGDLEKYRAVPRMMPKGVVEQCGRKGELSKRCGPTASWGGWAEMRMLLCRRRATGQFEALGNEGNGAGQPSSQVRQSTNPLSWAPMNSNGRRQAKGGRE